MQFKSQYSCKSHCLCIVDHNPAKTTEMVQIRRQQLRSQSRKRVLLVPIFLMVGTVFWVLSIQLSLFLPGDADYRDYTSAYQRSLRASLRSTLRKSKNLHYRPGSTQDKLNQQADEEIVNFARRRHDHKFGGKHLFENILNNNTKQHERNDLKHWLCSKWAVFTLSRVDSTTPIIQEIEDAMPSEDWCTTIVMTEAKRKYHESRQKYSGNDSHRRLHMISLSHMEHQGGATSDFIQTQLNGTDVLPSSLFSSLSPDETKSLRSINKNAGYLYVLQHGADYILDFEYGAELSALWKNLEETFFHSKLEDQIRVDVPLMGNVQILNPNPYIFQSKYTILGSTWPRGYPKHHERLQSLSNTIAFAKSIQKSSVGVVQQSSSQPDLDAQGNIMMIGTSTETFHYPRVATANRFPLLVPRHAITPYNSKATLHTPATLWALLLPTTVPSRIADVWRSYMAQNLMRNMNLKTLIVPPPQPQIASSGRVKNRIRTTQTSISSTPSRFMEEQLQMDSYYYTQVPNLLHSLEQFTIANENVTSLSEKVEDLYVHLYEEGFLESKDVLLVQQWLRALMENSYNFDVHRNRVPTPHYKNVVLMGQFNFATNPKQISTADLSSNDLIALLKKKSYENNQTHKEDWKMETKNNEETLIIQEDSTKNVAFWVQKWREVFTHVVVRGPFSPEQLETLQLDYGIKAFGLDGSKWNSMLKDDEGKYSPIANLIATLEDCKGQDNIDGVLYVHDDLFLNISDIVQIGPAAQASMYNFPRDQILASSQAHRPSYLDPRSISDPSRTYSIYGNGSLSKVNGQKFGSDQDALLRSLEHWQWNKDYCIPRLVDLAKDSRVDPYREKNGVGAGSIMIPPWEPSDFLYMPTAYAQDFIDIANLFLDHQVFLECAMPTILDMMRQKTQVQVHTRNLCTSWEEKERSTDKMIEGCEGTASENTEPHNPSFGVFHPFKLSNGLSSWDAMFDFVTYRNGTQ